MVLFKGAALKEHYSREKLNFFFLEVCSFSFNHLVVPMVSSKFKREREKRMINGARCSECWSGCNIA